ncbi:MAG: restriction endonuclease subunit S [Candidatus Accumulibacter sp.]|uniref:restriction endonuclease subunit S n=1 Tax=Accumulibacter sp. TaxID=2053492 RepID=UPI001A3B9641|nr:restriction endonuclease subunit S [Accumulibacter sp.]MBL8399500.1 restriction endonuclease subunit S [Accumulibacter sp.]MBN8519473.1 restriction endonuclease subunit S [Accumulibacter sp.]MBO3712937.1 restriction endonuclease subunit S [Accumulibacter sp.]
MNWPLVHLAPILASVIRGVTFAQADASGEPLADGVPVLRAGNIQQTLITDKDLVWVDRSFVSDDQYLQRNDIVVCTSSGSGALVGKSAILEADFEGTWGAFNAVIRSNPDVLNPQYLAYWLSSEAFRAWKERQVQGANIQNIRQSALEGVRLPLPTLPEQQRIVDVLQQAEVVACSQQSRRQQLDLMIKAALDRMALAIDEAEWEPLGTLVETRYGTSVSADATLGSGTPVLRIPNVMGGEVDVADMKYVDLPQAELKRLYLTNADVLIVRSNGNPDYVGRSAPITEDIAQSAMVYASYLIRLRTDTARLIPEYLSAFLNSAYGRAAMRNAIRTTAGQSNLSGENLTKVKLPVPDLAEQERFRDFWLEVRDLRRILAKSERAANELRATLSIQALSGTLTEGWREQNRRQIEAATTTRDALLRERGAKFSQRKAESRTLSAPQVDMERPARHWLMGELSEFQRQVFAAFGDYPDQPLLAEDPDVFARFCDDEQVSKRLQAFGPNLNNRIRRTLSQLASLGLIAKITLPKQNLDTGGRDYLKAFRPLRSDEFTRMADVGALRKALSAGEASYHFTVIPDFETSEHAGAGGMFQVADLRDENDADRTELVDQGKHYSTLEELAADIARRLGVPVSQVEVE